MNFVWRVQLGYDEVELCFTPKAIWLTVICLCRFILGTIKEMYIDWRWYKYEMYVPSWEEERRKGFRDSDRRIRKIERTKKMAQ